MQNFSFISLFGKKLDGVGKFTYPPPEWGVARSPRNRVKAIGGGGQHFFGGKFLSRAYMKVFFIAVSTPQTALQNNRRFSRYA